MPSSARDKNVVVGRQAVQSLSDLSPGPASVDSVDSATVLPVNGADTEALGHDGSQLSLPATESSSSSSDGWQEGVVIAAPWLLLDDVIPQAPLQIGRTLLPEVVHPTYLSDSRVRYLARALPSFVRSLAYTGATPFLHQNLWKSHQPESYQDCVSLSALYLCKTSANNALITNAINFKIAKLIASSRTWSLTEHLAAVQTLIVYQVMRLFDPSLNEQAQAQKHNLLLDAWAASLWKRSFIEPVVLATCYDTWVFNESLRRTVMMAIFVRCAWSCYTRGGLASQIGVLATIPFTKDAKAWTVQPEEWDSRVLPELLERDSLTVYTDFTDVWTSETEMDTLDSFGKLLLAASRGDDDPRLLG
ncbi:hypothetical protein E8E13_002506 [Curvularia kusanoi]|uniref:Uncharacterized protein n=1 Tax=Curvularia kusanoi TaxID=90978 RepID=A0A9P4W7M9_CURKU|nr:hypothetical protein E8E13_002506 [Curvularia kusanoi]